MRVACGPRRGQLGRSWRSTSPPRPRRRAPALRPGETAPRPPRPESSRTPACGPRRRSAGRPCARRGDAEARRVVAGQDHLGLDPQIGQSSGPPATAARKSRGSTPSPSASASASAVPLMTVSTQLLSTSLSRLAAPRRGVLADPDGAAPRSRRRPHRPAPAPPRAPRPGPSTRPSPRAPWCRARVRRRSAGRARAANAASGGTPSGPTVLVWAHTVPGRSRGRRLPHGSRTAGPSSSMVRTTSAPYRLGRGVGDADAVGGQRFGPGAGAVPDADVEPGRGEVAGHRGAHDAGAEHGY